MARVSDFFFQKNPSLKKKLFPFLRGVKVREDWLVKVNLFYRESKSKKKENNFLFLFIYLFFFWRGGGGGGGGEGA